MLAILVIAHPNNTKFKDKIGKLQIQWMMTQDRQELHVQDGFWRGITLSNLFSVFSPSEPRESDVPLLADYDRLLGADFLRCRKNIRPYLPAWAIALSFDNMAEDLVTVDSDSELSSPGQSAEPEPGHGHSLSPEDTIDVRGPSVATGDRSQAPGTSPDLRDPSVHTDTSYDGPQAPDNSDGGGGPSVHTGGASAEAAPQRLRSTAPPEVSAAEVSSMRGLLSRKDGLEAPELEAWLMQRLAEEDPILTLWCQYWDRRANQAADLLQQITTRELFVQCLRWLYNLYTSESPFVKACMLMNIADYQIEHPSKETYAESLGLLNAFPEYTAFQEATGQLARHAYIVSGQEGKDLITRTTMQQTCRFYNLSLGPHFSQVKKCIVFEHLRACVVLQNLPESTSPAAQRWRARYDLLLRDDTIAALQLTSWQMLTLAFPGADSDHFLTKCQAWYFWQVLASDSPSSNPRLCKPVPVATTTMPTGSLCKKHPALQKLLGDLVVQDASTADLLTSASSTSFLVSRYVKTPTPAVVPPVPEPAPAPPVTTPTVTTPTTSAATPANITDTAMRGLSRSQSLVASPKPATRVRPPGKTAAEATTDLAHLSFTGKTFVPSKRSASPGGKDPKKPRTDWGQQLQGLVEASAFCKEELSSLRADLSNIHSETGNISPHLATQIAKLQQHLQSSPNADSTGIRSDISNMSQHFTAQTAKLQDHLEALMRTHIETAHDKLRSDLTHQLAQCVSSNSAMLKVVERFLQDGVAESKKDLLAVKQDLTCSTTMLKADVEQSLKTEIAGVKQDLSSNLNTMAQSFKTELLLVKQDIAGVQGVVEAIRDPPRQPLRLGEEGFLRQECPAPPGWDQTHYEGQLERAVWSYIFDLGNPDGGVGEDGEAYEKTLATFPDLNARSFSIALQHIHMRVYHHALLRDEEEMNGDVVYVG